MNFICSIQTLTLIFLAIPVTCSVLTGDAKATGTEITGLANPASVFCEQHGGILEIRSDETAGGAEFGICIFADGSECGEWQFYRGDCAPGSVVPENNPLSAYCEKHSGIPESYTDKKGMEQQVCVFADGSQCKQWDFYRDKCQRGAQ